VPQPADLHRRRPQGALFDTLEASLADDGVLVLGMTESVPPDRSDRYEPIDKRRRVFRRV